MTAAPTAGTARAGGGAEAPLLSVRDLVTRFRSGRETVTAVDHVSFTLRRGETLGLVGESGSGKSVTALSILRLVPPPGRIESGAIELDGVSLLSLSEEEMRALRGAAAGMVFQNPMTALNPAFTAGWQLREALRAHGRDGADAAALVERALADVGMPDPRRQAESFPHQMSGGMRQRVVIAMGMVNQPRLLVADEPTTALDVTIQAQVLELLQRLTRERGAALLLITHNLGVIAKMCDRVAVMYAGEIVEEAPVEALFADSRHPYTQGLLQSIPRAEGGRGRLVTLTGAPPDMSRLPPGCRFRPRCPVAQARCDSRPALTEVAPGRLVRCWLTQDGRGAADAPTRGAVDAL